VGPMVVVEVLPLLELVVEQSGVVDDDAFELAVELLAVDGLDPERQLVQQVVSELDAVFCFSRS